MNSVSKDRATLSGTFDYFVAGRQLAGSIIFLTYNAPKQKIKKKGHTIW